MATEKKHKVEGGALGAFSTNSICAICKHGVYQGRTSVSNMKRRYFVCEELGDIIDTTQEEVITCERFKERLGSKLSAKPDRKVKRNA